MKCEHCEQEARVVDVELSDDKTQCRQEWGCVNCNCARFIGNDTNNPTGITKKGPWINL